MSTNILYIGLYNVDVSITIKTRSINLLKRIIYAKTAIIVPFNSSISIFIYYTTIPADRDFLFKPISILYLSLYAHLVDSDIYYVLAKNDSSEFVQILRNIKFGIIKELDFNNCFYITEDAGTVNKLAVKYSARPG